MLELLFLLLPIATAYGWYMGRRSARINDEQNRQAFSKNYFEGLNFLLSDQPDKAVDLFIDLLQVDDETFDTHLSLGNLFRKRGEVDRSIRIHQNLLARPSLPHSQRDLAMMELGKDYLAAGLFDRAEEIFLKMVKEPDHSDDAEQQLLSIYQATKEWHKAIDVAKGFRRANRKQLTPVIAHYHCELAEAEPDRKQAVKLLQRALRLDKHCARASIQMFWMARDDGDVAGQNAAFERLCQQDGGFAVELVEAAREPFQQAGRLGDYQQLLRQLLKQEGQVSVLLTLAQLVEESDGRETAQKLLLTEIKRQPTMRGFHKLMQLQLDQVDSQQAKESLTMLSDLVERQIRLRPRYRCQSCGFPGHTLYWHCPSCKSWSQIRRIRGLDGE